MAKAGCMFSLAILILIGSSASIAGVGLAIFFGALGGLFLTIANADNRISIEANAGNYVTGIPSLETRIRNVRMEIENDSLLLYQIIQVSRAEWQKLASIPVNCIDDVQVINRSVLENRLGGVLGVRVGWAFIGAPIQRTTRHELFYLVIAWLDGKFIRELVLEFAGEESQQKANHLADEVIKAANAASLEPGLSE